MFAMMKPWARGRRFWNLYTQLGLRLAILLAYIVALSVLLRGSATLGATYILSYTMIAVSLVYNGGHVKRLHRLLAVERRAGSNSGSLGCIVCLEVAAIITTSLVGFGILLIDTDSLGLSECTSEACDERKERARTKAEYAVYAAFCLWAVAGLHFLLVVFVSIQCCINKGLDRPESAVGAARQLRLQRAGGAGNNLQHHPPDNEHGHAEDGDLELPAYRPRESTTSIVAPRPSDEPPAYIERSTSLECTPTGPAAESTSNNPTR